MNITAQFIGFLAAIFYILSIQLKHKKGILVALIIEAILFTISFIMVKAYAGALLCFIELIQTVTSYYFTSKKKKIPRYYMVLFPIISIMSGYMTVSHIVDYLPVICSFLHTMLIFQKKECNIRRIYLIGATLWAIYDFTVGVYTGLLSDVFAALSALIAIIRYDYKRRK